MSGLLPAELRRLEEMIVSVGAFREVDPPVLGTSGIPLFYFVNTEKLLPDGGEWEKYGEDSAAMIGHACKYLKNKDFLQVVEWLFQTAKPALLAKSDWISGFQRRDWIFSGPMAQLARKEHLSIYKSGRLHLLQILDENRVRVGLEPDVAGRKTVHVSDLLTVGKSATEGWLPSLRRNGAEARTFLPVIDRNQGGKPRIESAGVACSPLLILNEDFLRRHCALPQRCLAYFADPEKAIGDWLGENGLSAFLGFFDPSPFNAGLERARLFWKRWRHLANAAQVASFKAAFLERYRIPFDERFGDFSGTGVEFSSSH